jgi:hypothetical protein
MQSRLNGLPLSRNKGQLEKVFADGVLAAEIIKHYFPNIVNIRNYQTAQTITDRTTQWRNLNSKVFRRIGLSVPSHVITQLRCF